LTVASETLEQNDIADQLKSSTSLTISG